MALITREKLIRLQSLYIDQFKRLQHLLKEKKRRYLHSRKVEHESLGKDVDLCAHLFATVLTIAYSCLHTREQPAHGPRRSVHEGEGEPEEAQSPAAVPAPLRRGGAAAPAAEEQEAGGDGRRRAGATTSGYLVDSSWF